MFPTQLNQSEKKCAAQMIPKKYPIGEKTLSLQSML